MRAVIGTLGKHIPGLRVHCKRKPGKEDSPQRRFQRDRFAVAAVPSAEDLSEDFQIPQMEDATPSRKGEMARSRSMIGGNSLMT